MLQRYLRGSICHLEAIGRTGCSNNRHGAFAVTAKESLQEVGLFALRRQAGSRSATLHVEHHERQFHDDSKVHCLTLQADAGATCAGNSQSTAIGSTHRTGTASNLVLALNGYHAKTLVFGQFVKNIRCRCDGIRTKVEFQSGLLGSSNETISRSLVARNVHVTARHLVLSLYTIYICHTAVRVVSVIISSLNDLDVCLCHFWLLGKLLTQESKRNVEVAVEEPAHQSKGKHISTLADALDVHTTVLQTILHHRRKRTGNHSVGIDTHLTKIVLGLELRLLQVLGSEAVGINNDGSIGLGKTILRLEGSSIHSHKHIALVAGCIDLSGTDVYLESTDTGERTLRSTDVGRIVGECTNTVAYGSRHSRKNISGELHAVAGITREPNYYRFFFLYFHIFLQLTSKQVDELLPQIVTPRS